MAKKKLVSTKASKTTTKVSKKQNNTSSEDKNSSVKVKEQKNELNSSALKKEKGNINSKKIATKILQFKLVIGGSLLLIILAILYYVQTNQIKKTDRTQDLKIEAQLEKFQVSLADKLVKNQNDKIEKINKDLNKVLNANEQLSQQNQNLVNQISELTKSNNVLIEKSSSEKDQTTTSNADNNSAETKKLLIAIKKTQETVENLELALRVKEFEKNISINLNELLRALNDGKPFWQPLSNITNELNLELSKEMKQNAVVGVKSIDDLRESFPQNARLVLKAIEGSRSTKTLKDKAILYIKSHVITRSLKPISGNSVNAILSRAEMNLNSDNLDQALVELEPLSKYLKTVMESWLSEAQANLEVRRELNAIFKIISSARENND
ncbi:mitofilin family membrane protein [Paracoccaceae bacterium]|nr:mitofilin family membrane protein [Paracoccaceae bacterium]